MNVNFNYRANNKFVVRCSNHGEVDRCASKVAAEVRRDALTAEKPHCTSQTCCGSHNHCKYTVTEAS